MVGRPAPFRGNDEERNAPIPEITWADLAPAFRTSFMEMTGGPCVLDDHPTGRQLMQLFGTEVIRNRFMPDVWVRIAQNRCRDFQGITLVDDVRFPNEAKMFDIVLKVERPGFPMSTHMSEVAVDQIPMDVLDAIFNNDGTIPDLACKVHDWACSVSGFRAAVEVA